MDVYKLWLIIFLINLASGIISAASVEGNVWQNFISDSESRNYEATSQSTKGNLTNPELLKTRTEDQSQADTGGISTTLVSAQWTTILTNTLFGTWVGLAAIGQESLTNDIFTILYWFITIFWTVLNIFVVIKTYNVIINKDTR